MNEKVKNRIIRGIVELEKDLLRGTVELIDKDITWHLNNANSALSRDYQKGFINGLIQAKYLVGEVSRVIDDA